MRRWLWFLFFLTVSSSAEAGMPSYNLNDVFRLRMEDISFFIVVLLLVGLGIRFLWNQVARDFDRMPKLTYSKALSLTALLSIFMLLVLSMISGARELLTPGAWRKQGSQYRLNDPASEPLRRQSVESLRATLQSYAAEKQGKFPPHDFVPSIPEKIWQTPDSQGSRYIYFGGLTQSNSTDILAVEPMVFGEDRFVLFGSGEIRKMNTDDIRKKIGKP